MQATSPPGDSMQSLPERPSPIKPVVWGALLIVCGVLFFLQSLGFFPNAAAWLICALFAVVAAVFLALYLNDREKSWWAAIPGMTLAGLALLIYMGAYGGALGAAWGAPIFLASIAFGFLLAMVARKGLWWAVIPFGVLISVAIMVGLTASGTVSPEQGVAVLFFGMAGTFLILPFLSGQDRRWWSLIPAAVLGGMGWVFYTGNFDLLAQLGWIGPVVMIVAGIWIVYRAVVKPRTQ